MLTVLHAHSESIVELPEEKTSFVGSKHIRQTHVTAKLVKGVNCARDIIMVGTKQAAGTTFHEKKTSY